MSHQIEFTQTAKNDLREIARYIAEESKEIGVALYRRVTSPRFATERIPKIGRVPQG